MPKRYVCKECGNVQHKKNACENCGADMEVLEFPWTLYTTLPYLFAVGAGIVLLSAYLSRVFGLIWLTFPLILIGLIIDHYYQNKLDLKAKEKTKKIDPD